MGKIKRRTWTVCAIIIRVVVMIVAVALAAYGIASIWCPDPIASSPSWVWCILSFLKKFLLSVLVVGALLLTFLLPWCKRNSKITHNGAKCVKARPSKLRPCPYYKLNRKKITCFTYKSDLHLIRFAKGIKSVPRKDQYVVAKPYTVSFKLGNGGPKCITVPKGMLTDLSSAPFPFRYIIGRVGPHLEATIVHDYLYVAWQDYECYEEAGCECESICAKKCDGKRFEVRGNDSKRKETVCRLMLEGMKASGMGCMAYLIYWGIWIGGGCTFRGRNPNRYVDLDECECRDGEGCERCDSNTSCDCGSDSKCDSAEGEHPAASPSSS